MKEYPTDEQLKKIREWDYADFHGLMDYIFTLWEYPEFGWKRDGEIYYISTAGWSGNEEIIGALQDNQMFWLTCWEQSKRGGHYIFCKMTFENFEKLSK